MKVNSEVQAPRPPIRERQPAPTEEAREQATKTQEKQPEPPKPDGPVGRNLDTQA